MRNRTRFAIGFGIMTAVLATTAAAMPGSFGTDLLDAFNGVVDSDVHNFITDTTGAMYQFVWAEWAFFTIFIIVITTVNWIFGKAGIPEVIAAVLMITGVASALLNYDYLTQAIWSFSDLGLAYQNVALGNGADIMWPAKLLNKIVDNISIADVNIFVDSLKVVLWTALYLLLAVLIEIAFYLTSAWSVLGYALSKIIGFVFVPLIMVSWTRGFFDGWLKLFTGFILFNIVGRVIMVMLVRFLQAELDPTNPITINPSSGFDGFMSTVAFLTIGLLFLISAGGFAAILAGGFVSMQSAGSNVMRTIRMASSGILGGK